MIGCRQEIEQLRRAYELSQSLEMREDYNQPNENLTSDGMKTLQVECSRCRGVIDRKKIDVVE